MMKEKYEEIFIKEENDENAKRAFQLKALSERNSAQKYVQQNIYSYVLFSLYWALKEAEAAKL